MPRKEINQRRKLKVSVPREVRGLLKFVNADRAIAGDEVSIRRQLRDWLTVLVSGGRLPPHVVTAPYVLNTATVAGDWRSTLDWFTYRVAMEWLAADGRELLRECPKCGKWFLALQRSTRKFCEDCPSRVRYP